MNARAFFDADMKAVSGWIVAGWRWWLGELAAMVPPRWRRQSLGSFAYLAWEPQSRTLRPIGDMPPRPGMPIAVVMPAGLILLREIEYPAVAEADLAGLVELDADRIMPLPRGDVLLGTRVLRRDRESGRLTAEIAGMSRAAAETLCAALADQGVMPARIFPAMPEAEGPAPIDLMPAFRRAGLAKADRRAAALWLGVAFLFALNLGLLIWRDAAAVENLAATVEQQQPAVNVAHGIIARMRRADDLAAAVVAARRTREPVALLGRIARALPPGSWIQRLSWQGTTLQIAGFHPPRAGVPDAMRRAGFSVTRYSEPSNAAPTTFGEPFEITLRQAGS